MLPFLASLAVLRPNEPLLDHRFKNYFGSEFSLLMKYFVITKLLVVRGNLPNMGGQTR